MKLALRLVGLLAAVLAIGAALFAIYVGSGMRAHAQYGGAISGLRLTSPVTVLRDDRGVPHIVASNAHDLFFAQGYAEGADRLFQMDLLRRFVLGELAEVFGAAALGSDRAERAVPVAAIVRAQWLQMDAGERAALQAFSDGVNAAIAREPLPVEFRLLAYRPKTWSPADSLAVAMATVLDLTDDWDAIAPRDEAMRKGGTALLNARFPLTDPCYDAPVTMGLAGMGPGPRCKRHLSKLVAALGDLRAPIGSNEWAAGAAHGASGRALLANDPHLGLRIPGVWYLVDLRAPGFHAAGATFPGAPGVVLGHNERIAWAATNGTVTSLSIYDPPARLDPRWWQTERFHVRFHADESARYYRTPALFGVTTERGRFVLVRWDAYVHPVSPAATFVALDRAGSIEAATAALARYPGPTQNFAFADVRGRAAYVLAGAIPNDPVRARWIHPAADLLKAYPDVPFAALPKVAPSREAIVWTANNRMYGPAYPLVLSPQFASPYRAYRIAELLRARKVYDAAYFAQMQMDALSLPELELARDLAPAVRSDDPVLGQALARWDGRMSADSTAATVVAHLRMALTRRHNGRMPALLTTPQNAARALRGIPMPSPAPWGVAGAVTVLHAFASLGIPFLNGTTLPGLGDAYTIHVQDGNHTQSFHAVWEAGNWDEGGITLPQGESGQPGSGHYTDQAQAWNAGRLWPLPFSDAAVARTAVVQERLLP